MGNLKCVIPELILSRLITNSCPDTQGVLDNICYLRGPRSIRSSSGSWVVDSLKRYDDVLHWQWSIILDFNAMYMYHYPDEINLGGSRDVFVTEISVLCNTSQFTCMVTCPIWSLALAVNSITSSAKVRHMVNKSTALEPIHCNPRRGQRSQAKPRPQQNRVQISWDVL